MLGKIKITDFALRHFDPKSGGTKILNLEPKEFEQRINSELQAGPQTLVHQIYDGYAPFCKLLAIENFTDAKTGTLPITIENYQYLRSGYSARREGEFAVFSQWLELPMKSLIPKAKYLIVILYDKNQVNKEMKSDYEKKLADNSIDSNEIEAPEPFDADWGVVAILGQMQPEEEPMKPITMMRNYMDLSMGGSGMKIPTPPEKPSELIFDTPASYGLAIDEYNKAVEVYNDEMRAINEKYQKSVDFWSENATVK
jgi:hypothetical protein